MALRIRQTKPTTLIVAAFAFFTLGLGGWTLLQQPTIAADLRQFDPGNIMSDAVMSNKDSMTEAQIQAFLNSKNACNNTNTQLAAQYPHLKYNIKNGRFVCMAQERFDGESAARIIWKAGQDYNINPQVLIVLLQKEQGLVTDTWPNHVQYRTATGYGCPDTAPCDEQYYGLKNQVRLAAAMFRTVLNGGWSNYPVGNNYVLYNPNHSCGGTNINIKNRATSALYRYTPYQPNKSALNAGYGTGDSCGAYGNRNFWLYFTDWFGNTQAELFSEMDAPRQLYTKTATHKIDPVSGSKTENLPANLLINFRQKATYRGSVCLRTQTDTDLEKQMCVLESNLSEIFSNMAVPRKLISKKQTSKIDPITGDATESIPAGTEIDFVQLSTYLDGNLCLRTKADQRANKQMCVRYDDLYEVDENYSAMDVPRLLRAKKSTSKINPITLGKIPNQTLITNQTARFTSRATTEDGQLCLRTEANTNTKSNMCVLYSDLEEILSTTAKQSASVFSSMDKPRKLVTTKETTKIDAVTKKRYDPLPKGLVIDFEMRTDVNSQLCLRTKTDVRLSKNSCVLYSDLREIN